ncbi:MAG: DUF488 domain-containing protein [Planctomycetia bacterium]|nr:DUF488 domain-containing protein [Planctomycetia bacterium]
MMTITAIPSSMLTIGHSDRTIDEFLGILAQHRVEFLADVRKMPRSRKYPQFNNDALASSLAAAGIGYEHFPGLGGLRPRLPDSPNAGWRNASFRAYADYMLTAEFEASLDALLALARQALTVIMCAEAVPWRCHRSLIADALLVRGVAVNDIYGAARARPHELTSFAHVVGTRITYPPMAEDSAASG